MTLEAYGEAKHHLIFSAISFLQQKNWEKVGIWVVDARYL